MPMVTRTVSNVVYLDPSRSRSRSTGAPIPTHRHGYAIRCEGWPDTDGGDGRASLMRALANAFARPVGSSVR